MDPLESTVTVSILAKSTKSVRKVPVIVRKFRILIAAVRAAVRLNLSKYQRLTSAEIHHCKVMYDRAGGITSLLRVQQVLAEMGHSITLSTLQSIAHDVRYREGHVFTLEQFVKSVMFKKKEFERGRTEDVTLTAFVALGGRMDRKGQVDTSLLRKAVQEFGLLIDIEKLIREADQDNTGTVDFDEFEIMLKNDESATATPRDEEEEEFQTQTPASPKRGAVAFTPLNDLDTPFKELFSITGGGGGGMSQNPMMSMSSLSSTTTSVKHHRSMIQSKKDLSEHQSHNMSMARMSHQASDPAFQTQPSMHSIHTSSSPVTPAAHPHENPNTSSTDVFMHMESIHDMHGTTPRSSTINRAEGGATPTTSTIHKGGGSWPKSQSNSRRASVRVGEDPDKLSDKLDTSDVLSIEAGNMISGPTEVSPTKRFPQPNFNKFLKRAEKDIHDRQERRAQTSLGTTRGQKQEWRTDGGICLPPCFAPPPPPSVLWNNKKEPPPPPVIPPCLSKRLPFEVRPNTQKGKKPSTHLPKLSSSPHRAASPNTIASRTAAIIDNRSPTPIPPASMEEAAALRDGSAQW
eukprot:PhF_6_TR2179/c0_g1_i1/m.3572